MQKRALLGIAVAVLLAGCSTSKELSSAGQSVKFTDKQPGSGCRLVGQVTDSQSTWLTGHDEGNAQRGAANDLRNKAAALGGNVIYGATSSSESFWSSFAPLDSKLVGQVYHCP
ncbi:MAG: DUF4156 domain-containing protein [Symbiopectobacterium sp.]|uniref:DUF4156 domain-containing protein n=1 Tax=Symbiopectobacterium sp. TaxID=2952789 RepID=UPI0039EA580F